MKDLVWINGVIKPFADATVGIEDRGFQFADGIYEVIRLYDGIPYTLAEHLDRLRRSADGISLPVPLSIESLSAEIAELISVTGIGEGMVYLQLTRGPAPRLHAQPANPAPTLLFYCRPLDPLPAPGQAPGVRLWSVIDERWKRCWIKSIALLPNTLAKTAAVAAGADEAVFIDAGIVTECAASNLFAIRNGRLCTHPVGPKVLPGITRQILLELAPSLGIPVEERPLTESEAREAEELFITSTTRELSWVSHWNDHPISPSHCGPLTLKLHQAFLDHRQGQTAEPLSLSAGSASDGGRPREAALLAKSGRGIV
ncbi:MAG TPA: aminotransferase class IV [Tepidisphaeraceae bacterium]|jgi:D-alanine transaminase|nr:aminotransferase class IV [Tepidisphaeraceae bacterium]